jgi:hypothetical protein
MLVFGKKHVFVTVPGLSQNGTGLFFCSTQEKQNNNNNKNNNMSVAKKLKVNVASHCGICKQ